MCSDFESRYHTLLEEFEKLLTAIDNDYGQAPSREAVKRAEGMLRAAKQGLLADPPKQNSPYPIACMTVVFPDLLAALEDHCLNCPNRHGSDAKGNDCVIKDVCQTYVAISKAKGEMNEKNEKQNYCCECGFFTSVWPRSWCTNPDLKKKYWQTACDRDIGSKIYPRGVPCDEAREVVRGNDGIVRTKPCQHFKLRE